MSLAPTVPAATPRSSALEVLVESESTEWVECLIAVLEGEGRLIEGGWPGTVSEARRRVMAYLRTHPQEPRPDNDEVTNLVDLLYCQAKQLWLRECS